MSIAPPTLKKLGAFLIVSAVMGAMAFTASANAGKSHSGKSAGKINVTIGAVMDETGSGSPTGVEHVRALNLAIRRINATSKTVHLSVIFKNSNSDPADAVSALQSLLANPHVNVITGGDLGAVCLSLQPLLAADGRPAVLMQCSSITGRGPNTFSLAPPRGTLAKNTVIHVLKPMGITSAALIWHQNPVLMADAQGFRDGMAASGIKLLADEGAAATTTDFSAQITDVLSKNPDAIGLAVLPAPSGAIVSQLRARGYKGLIFGQQAMDSGVYRQAAGSAADGSIIFTFWDPAVTSKASADMIARYTKAYPTAPYPDVFVAQGWDAAQVIAEAVTKAGSANKTALVNALQTKVFSGVENSRFAFNTQTGYARLSGYVIQMVGNGSKLLWPKAP